jgi:transcriptional regulator with XRE-family HTH domain
MIDRKAFGKRVAKTRERRRLSVQDLADLTGLSYQTLWRIERGSQGDPSLSTVASIARKLEVSMDYLAGLYEDEESERMPTAAALVGA